MTRVLVGPSEKSKPLHRLLSLRRVQTHLTNHTGKRERRQWRRDLLHRISTQIRLNRRPRNVEPATSIPMTTRSIDSARDQKHEDAEASK